MQSAVGRLAIFAKLARVQKIGTVLDHPVNYWVLNRKVARHAGLEGQEVGSDEVLKDTH